MVALKKPSEDQHTLPKGFFLSRHLLFISIIFLGGVAGTLFYLLRGGSPLEQGMSALVSACSEMRVIEPRLSGGFKWARLATTDEAGAIISSEEMETARDLIGGEALEKESPEALHAYGRLLAIEGKLNEAMGMFRKVISSQPQNAQAINDLGVCLLQQEKLEDAVEQFEQALEIEPESREALFNRAVCYEQMLLMQAAIAEFEQVARAERDTGWAKEARSSIEILSRPLKGRLTESEIQRGFDSAMAEGNLDEARRIADEHFEVLTGYALIHLTLEHLNAAVSEDSNRSQSALAKIEAIGRFFVETKEDRYIADTAEYLRKLSEKDRPAELSLINDYVEAVNLSNSPNARVRDAAASKMAGLAEAFRARGNIMRAERAELRVARFFYESNRLWSSLETIKKVLPVVEGKEWMFERAWVFGHMGILYARLGSDSQALDYCQRAISLTRELREKAQIAKHLQTISLTYGHLGDLDKSLASYRESLKLTLSTNPQPSEIAFTYFDVANIYHRQRNQRLALLFAEQALRYCELSEDVNRTAQALTLLSLVQMALQQPDQAKSSLTRALELLPMIDPAKRLYTEPLILSQAGEVALISGDAEQAIDYYTRAESLASKTEDNKFLLINSIKGRAAAYARQNQIDRSRLDVARMLDIIENYREGIAESKYRSSFLEASQDAFDQAISLNMTAFANPKEAFDLSERARGRALLDQIAFQRKGTLDRSRPTHAGLFESAKSLKLNRVRDALPEDLTLVEYSISQSQTYIFIVSRTGFSVKVSHVSSELLDRLARLYLDALRSPSQTEQLRKSASELYDYLIKPIKDQIPHNSYICIVPDKVLHYIPFAALIDDNGGYLINSYNLSYAPSASVLVHCIEEDSKKVRSERERIAAVGNPLFDPKRFKDLSQLPEAEREASESAMFYTDPIILKRHEATEPQVLAAMKECEVAHLALHCLIEEKSPWLAALVLGNSNPAAQQMQSLQAAPNDDGMLQLDELYSVNLPRTRLVVLSACQSALGQYYRGEGIVSLVRPFLSSGVPTVVASLWPVQETATASLMIDFHKQRKLSDKRASEALRAAQMNMSSGGRFEHPYYWAPFIAIGSAN